MERAWRIVDDLYVQAVQPPTSVGSLEVENELLFCLMGGFGITFEHGRSAAEVVWQLRPFSSEWEDRDLLEAVSDALNHPQFEPTKTDGTLRRYRFPLQRAATIVKARNWLHWLTTPSISDCLEMSNGTWSGVGFLVVALELARRPQAGCFGT